MASKNNSDAHIAIAVVFVALVSVVVFQVRRRRRRQRDLEEAGNGRPSRRKASATNTKIQECDLEKGVDVMGLAEDDIETESEEVDIPESKRKVCPLSNHLHQAQSNDIVEKA